MGFITTLGTAVLAAAATVQGQMATWTSTDLNVTYGVAVPNVTSSTTSYDMLISITAPAKTGWAGISLGGCMLRSPLIVTWANGSSVTAAPRWASAYHAPAWYNGSTVTMYPTSKVNATHMVANFLCSGCSSWAGGSVNASGANPFGYGLSSRNVTTPTSPQTAIGFHDIAKDHFELDLSKARLSTADWGSLVKSFGGSA